MRTYLCSGHATGTKPDGRSQPPVARVLLATLLLLALAQPLALAHGQLLSSASAAPTAETTAGDVPVVRRAAHTDSSPAIASSASEPTTGDHHTTVAGIPTPLALAVGAVTLVLVLLLLITALTRHRQEDDHAFLDFEK